MLIGELRSHSLNIYDTNTFVAAVSSFRAVTCLSCRSLGLCSGKRAGCLSSSQLNAVTSLGAFHTSLDVMVSFSCAFSSVQPAFAAVCASLCDAFGSRVLC